MAFSGGSAYSMARDIAEGYSTLNERTFKTMVRGGAPTAAQVV